MPKHTSNRSLYSRILPLDAAIKTVRDSNTRRRLKAVALMLKRRISRQEIPARTGFSPSTVYSYLRRFHEHGCKGLLDLRPRGRPKQIPEIVRERFAYLCRPDPSTGKPNVIYAIERERLVFTVLGARFTARQIGRWYADLMKEHPAQGPLRKFRTLRSAYRHLRAPEIDLVNYPTPKTARDFKRVLRVDVLSYASDRYLGDRELYRRLISAIHNIPLKRISFAGEPGLATADFAWDVKPEEREPEDILAPLKKSHVTSQRLDECL